MDLREGSVDPRLCQETAEFRHKSQTPLMVQGKMCFTRLLLGGCLSPVFEHTAVASTAAAIFSVWVLRGPDHPTRSWKLCRDCTTTSGARTHTAQHSNDWGDDEE